MFLGQILDLVNKQKQQSHHKMCTRNILIIIIAMGAGAAVGFAATLCCTQKSKRVGHKDLSEKSDETVGAIMNAVENIQGKTETVKEDIKSGYECFKQNAQEAAEKISNLSDETTE